jgi:hypothetical protein
MTDDRRDDPMTSDVRGLLEAFLLEQRRIEAKRAAEERKRVEDLDKRELVTFRNTREGFKEVADRLIASFTEHEQKDDRRHTEAMGMHRETREKLDALGERVHDLEQEREIRRVMTTHRRKWKPSDTGSHMVADLQDAMKEEQMWKALESRGELQTYHWLKKNIAVVVTGVLIIVIAAFVVTVLRLQPAGEPPHTAHEAAGH